LSCVHMGWKSIFNCHRPCPEPRLSVATNGTTKPGTFPVSGFFGQSNGLL
jgi:hypothetical protein